MCGVRRLSHGAVLCLWLWQLSLSVSECRQCQYAVPWQAEAVASQTLLALRNAARNSEYIAAVRECGEQCEASHWNIYMLVWFVNTGTLPLR